MNSINQQGALAIKSGAISHSWGGCTLNLCQMLAQLDSSPYETLPCRLGAVDLVASVCCYSDWICHYQWAITFCLFLFHLFLSLIRNRNLRKENLSFLLIEKEPLEPRPTLHLVKAQRPTPQKNLRKDWIYLPEPIIIEPGICIKDEKA